MALSSATIATAIAALSVSGVTIKDLSAQPTNITVRDCPVMFPKPNEWKDGGNGEPADGPATFGTPTTRYWVFNRTYRYTFAYAPADSGRNLQDYNPGMSAKEDLILTALTTLDVSGADVMNVSTSGFGIVEDGTGNSFHGMEIAVTMREKVNA